MPRALSDAAIEDFRERLIDAAEHLFAAHGLEAVTMRQLAGELGVSPMTPYRYFKDKDDILAAVRARGFNRHAEALERALRDTPGDLGTRAAAVSDAYVDFAFANPEAYKLMFDTAQPGERAYPDLVAAEQRSRRTMTQHLRELTAAGLWEGDADLVGHMFWAALHGPIMLEFSGMLGPGRDAVSLIRALRQTLSLGVFAGAGARSVGGESKA
jgi:AcrR family transcriptional regulator